MSGAEIESGFRNLVSVVEDIRDELREFNTREAARDVAREARAPSEREQVPSIDDVHALACAKAGCPTTGPETLDLSIGPCGGGGWMLRVVANYDAHFDPLDDYYVEDDTPEACLVAMARKLNAMKTP